MVVPAFTATLSPAMRSVSSLVVNLAAGALLEETLSIMRTSSVVPAGSVTLAGAGWERPVGEGTGGAAAGAEDAPAAEVKVSATTCDVSTACSPASFLKRTVEAVPPWYFPLRIV